MDARSKIFILLFFSVGVFFVDLRGLALYFLFLIAYVLCATVPEGFWATVPEEREARLEGPSPKSSRRAAAAPIIATLKVATPLYIICIISFLCNALTWTGTGLAFYAAGIERGIFYCARILLLGWFSIYIANSISLIKFAAVFKWFLWPLRHLRVPVESISMACAIALRFIPEIYIEFQSVKEAQWARGAKMDSGGVAVRTRAYCGCFVPLLVRMLIASDELASALDSRCWGARVVPPSEDLNALEPPQIFITILACAILVCIAVVM